MDLFPEIMGERTCRVQYKTGMTYIPLHFEDVFPKELTGKQMVRYYSNLTAPYRCKRQLLVEYFLQHHAHRIVLCKNYRTFIVALYLSEFTVTDDFQKARLLNLLSVD